MTGADPIRDIVVRLRPTAISVSCSRVAGADDTALSDFPYISLYDERIDSNVVSSRTHGLIIINNTYLASFAYNILLVWVVCERSADRPNAQALRSRALRHNFKKFYAEQCLRLRNSIFSRALLFETLLFEQQPMVAMFDEKSKNPDLNRMISCLARMVVSLVSFHELGHYSLAKSGGSWSATELEQFDILEAVHANAIATCTAEVADEFKCDAISLAMCLRLYAPSFDRQTVLRGAALSYAIFASLTSLTCSARDTTAVHERLPPDDVQFDSTGKEHRDFDYVMSVNPDLVKRAELMAVLCERIAKAEGLTLYGTTGDIQISDSLIADLLQSLKEILESNDDNARQMALLVAVALHGHDRGTEYLKLHSRTFEHLTNEPLIETSV